MNEDGHILEVKDLYVRYGGENLFSGSSSGVNAVNGVTFTVKEGQTFALVGESGSGKTSVAMAVLRFVKPSSGTVIFDGSDMWKLKGEKLRSKRSKLQPVFQDVGGSLNPKLTIGRSIEDGLSDDEWWDAGMRCAEVDRLLSTVGLLPEHSNKYPHELSGGQRQRACVARALAPNPRMLILDEPLSSQDLSVRSKVLNMLLELKRERLLTYLLITHDVRIVSLLADEMAVMKDGELVEKGSVRELFSYPANDYTRMLLKSSGFGPGA